MVRKTRTKTGDAVTPIVNKLRNKIRADVKQEILKDYKKFQMQGKYPWERMWLKRENIIKCQKKLKWRDKIVFLEIVIILLSMAFISLMTLGFTISLLPT